MLFQGAILNGTYHERREGERGSVFTLSLSSNPRFGVGWTNEDVPLSNAYNAVKEGLEAHRKYMILKYKTDTPISLCGMHGSGCEQNKLYMLENADSGSANQDKNAKGCGKSGSKSTNPTVHISVPFTRYTNAENFKCSICNSESAYLVKNMETVTELEQI